MRVIIGRAGGGWGGWGWGGTFLGYCILLHSCSINNVAPHRGRGGQRLQRRAGATAGQPRTQWTPSSSPRAPESGANVRRADKVTAPGRSASTVSASSAAFTYSSRRGRHGAPPPPPPSWMWVHTSVLTQLLFSSCCLFVSPPEPALLGRPRGLNPSQLVPFATKFAGKMGKAKAKEASARPASPCSTGCRRHAVTGRANVHGS